MKRFLAILLGALAVFLGLAIAQEQQVFLSLLGLRASGVAAAPPASADGEIVPTVRTFLAVMTHLYASSGDPRFAERLPATRAVVEEILADVTYLGHNRRVQEMSLVDLAVDAVDQAAADSVVVSTTEYWVIRTRWLDREGESDPPRSEVQSLRYRLERNGESWQVTGWEVIPPARRTVPAG